MVSVMAVKIQFSSPSGVLLSFSLPGILWGSGGPQKMRKQGTDHSQGSRPSVDAAHGPSAHVRPL